MRRVAEGGIVDDRIAHLEATVDQLRATLWSIERRIAALEARRPAGAVDGVAGGAPIPEGETRPVPSVAAALRDPYDPIVVLSLIGRLFLVLAGGFFLRAMTEAGVLAVPAGVASAFVYGLVWLALAGRAARRQQPTSAAFHALGAALVAFPLLVEATLRFEVINGPAGALLLFALTAGFLLVAWRRQLHSIAWITLLAALPAAVILLVKTAVVSLFGLYLIALGIAALWAAYLRGWNWLRWPAALAANLAVVGVTLRTLSPVHQDWMPTALLLQMTLLVAYLVSIAIQTLIRDRNVTAFDVVQTAAALVIGLGGAAWLVRAHGARPVMLGLASVVLGAACYVSAFALVGKRPDRERNLYYYTTLALILVLAGLAFDVSEHWLGAILAVLGVLATGLWAQYGRPFMLLHGASYAVAASVTSGAIAYAGWALAAGQPGAWELPGAIVMFVLAASALSAWFAAARAAPAGALPASALRFIIILVLVWTAGGCIVGYVAPLLAGLADGAADPGALATVRTAVLAAAALLTAWIARHERFREWAWLVYPLLVGIGLKMVVQDFKYSRPATLFIALALYGTALILAPRLKRIARDSRIHEITS
jgi:hypothetical protein